MNSKEQHTQDVSNTLKLLEGKTDECSNYRRGCLNEFLTFLETGKTDHINA